ncbi:MAG TPA: hypothetical protein DIW31_02650 [Bacteroidales bacterium]|nr:hypothetical protein [Bacteroidales bacterium]
MAAVNSKNKNIKNDLAKNDFSRSSFEFESMIRNLRVPSGKSKEQVWQAIHNRIDSQSSIKIIPIGRIVLKIAASVLLALAFGGSVWILGFEKVTVYSPKGQHITQILPDSSSVQLNADTRISYNKVLWFINRKVYINGEALFKVKKGKRFDVVADLATTSVLGTTFDVYARNGKVKVSCIEGRVSVTNNSSRDKVILTAGFHTQSSSSKITEPTTIIKHDDVAWTYGEFYFTNAPIKEVIKEIERQFNVEIVYKNSSNRFYTGFFNNKDLNTALRLVCIPMEVSYTINGNLIEIK